MKIKEHIRQMIEYSGTVFNGQTVSYETERDRVLFGDDNRECTGIVTTIYASVEVIEKAAQIGANLIVCHESLFWNHGDHTDWLSNNDVYQKKRYLLEKYKICVWRNHDHIHAGVKLQEGLKDGIFYGLVKKMGWEEYVINDSDMMPRELLIPQITARQLADQIKRVLHLQTLRFIGNPESVITRVYLPMHLLGRLSDNGLISRIKDDDINCLLTLELVDFTVAEYVRDAGQLKEDRCIFALGHFNFEEVGMEYYADYIREYIRPDVNVQFIQAGDMYKYM